MRDKLPKSQLIRLDNLATKKARRRLIGSIFLLVIALLVLFHISSKIKPLQIKPESIEIKTHPQQNSNATLINNPIILESKTAVINHQEQESISIKANNNSAPLKSVKKLLLSNDDTNPEKRPASGEHKTNENVKLANLHLMPIIVTEEERIHKPTPEDILNGTLPEKPRSIYFVQLMTSGDKAKLTSIKNKLAHDGISANLQSIKHGSDMIYSLRLGPFNDKTKAKNKLTSIQNKLSN